MVIVFYSLAVSSFVELAGLFPVFGGYSSPF